jgi:hypothetical protein
MPNSKCAEVDRYIAHAKKYGVDGCWQAASCELATSELAELAGELSGVARQRREPFKLSQDELARLTSPDPPDPAKSGENDQQHQAIIRNENGTVDDSPSSQGVTDSRRCERCSAPLPTSLRADARYCPNGACKQAAYRKRSRQKTQ